MTGIINNKKRKEKALSKKKKVLENIIESDLSELEKKLYTIDDRILQDNVDNKQIEKELLESNKLKMKTLIRINTLYYENKNIDEEKYNDFKSRIEHIEKLLLIFDEYNKSNTQKDIRKSIDTLTTISIIILPLTLITSFFGMNLKSLGNLTQESGIFSIKNIHLYIICFFGIYIGIVIFILYSNNIRII